MPTRLLQSAPKATAFKVVIKAKQPMDADKVFDRTLLPIMLVVAIIGAVVGFYVGVSGLGIIVGLIFAVVGTFLGAFCGIFIAGALRSWS